MNVFDLVAILTLNSKGYEDGMQSAEGTAKSFQQNLSGGMKKAAKVGVAAVAGVTAVTTAAAKNILSGAKATAAYGDEIDKTSQKVGMSAEAYQKWDYVMKISGTEMSNMTMGLKTLTNKVDDAKNGSEAAQEMFAKLGISVEDLNTMSREDIFAEVITGFQGMEDSAERAALANDILGRSGQELTPLFNTSAEETRKLREETEKYGMVMSGDAVKASATFQDRLTRLSSTITGVKNKVYSEFLPGLTKITEGLSGVIAGSEEAGDQMSEGFEEAIDTMLDKLPNILNAAGKVVKGLANGIIKNLPKLAKAGTELILKFGRAIIQAIPKIAYAGAEILKEVMNGLGDALPQIIPQIADAVVAIAEAFIKNIDTLIKGAGKFFSGLVEGLKKALPTILREIPKVIKELVNAIGSNLTTLLPVVGLAAGKTLLGALGTSLKEKNVINDMLTGPTGLVTKLAVGLAVVGVLLANSFDEAYETAKEGAAKITPVEQDLIDKLQEEAKKWDEIKEKRGETAKEIDEQVGEYKKLWDRLQEITDAQGNVKKGYEEEAEAITTTLSEALGIEVGLVDGQIQGYEELRKQIDATIEKKKAEMLLEAFRDDWVNARKNQKAAEEELKTATDLYNDALKTRAEGEAELAKVQEKINKLDQDGMKGTYDYQNAYDALELELKQAQGKIDGANEALQRHSDEIEEAKKNTGEYQSTIENYNAVMDATAKGGAEEISEATLKMVNSFKTAKTGTKQELAEQTNEWLKEFQKQTELVEKYGDEESKQAQEDARNMVKWSIQELSKLDDKMADEFDKAVRAVKGYAPKFKEIGENSAKGIAKGFNSSSRFVTDAAKQTMRDAISAAKKYALIASPSKLFENEVGLMLGKGVAVGIEDSEKYVEAASKGLIKASVPNVDAAASRTGEGGAADGVTINVYGATGQDVSALADEVALRFQRMYRKGVYKFA